MNYGLGFVLSFTDKASRGIQNVATSLVSLTRTAEDAKRATEEFGELASLVALSQTADRLGNTLTNKGASIMSFFEGAVNRIVNTGSSLSSAEAQLDQLYADSDKTGAEVLGNITEYAKKSIFSIDDLIPMVTSLKAKGVDAFDSITSSTEKSSQSILDYAADLAAFNPNMRNTYGTGINAALGAISEFITEGNATSIKRGASVDIKEVLGVKELGKTQDERRKQLADFIEKLNMVGVAAGMAQTPMNRLNNLMDTFSQFIALIADSGVYDAFNEIIGVFVEFVESIPPEELKQIAQDIAGIIVDLLEPAKTLAGYVVKIMGSLINLIKEHPNLVKLGIASTVIAGALSLIAGLSFKGLSSVITLFVTLSELGPNLAVISEFLGTAIPALLSSLGAILPTIIPIILAVVAAIGVLYFAWKTDFANIRTNVTEFVDNIKTSFQDATEAVSGSYEDMINAMSEKKIDPNSFWGGLTTAIMKGSVIIDALKEGWDDFTISDDTYKKADKLGVLGIIEGVFDAKYRIEEFIDGFITSFDEKMGRVKKIYDEKVKPIFDEIWERLGMRFDGTIFEGIFNSLDKISQLIKNTDPEKFREIGSILGSIFGGGAEGAADAGASVFSTHFEILKGFLSLVTTLGTAIQSLGIVVKEWWMNNIYPIIEDVIQFATDAIDIYSQIAGKLFEIFGALIDLFLDSELVSGIVDFVKEFFGALSEYFNENIKKPLDYLAKWVSTKLTLILSGVSGLYGSLTYFIFDLAGSIKSVLGGAFDFVKQTALGAFQGIVKGIFGLINSVIDVLNPILEAAGKETIQKLTNPFVPEDAGFFAEGGIVTRPTRAIIGEDGAEAVMPLKNNTEWIGNLANDLSNRMISRGSSNEASRGNVDNSVVFNEGAIQINCKDASEEEAQRLAKRIIAIIKRQKEIDDITSYAY